mgnify:CR=1 FL=1|jgi:hypothetical protein
MIVAQGVRGTNRQGDQVGTRDKAQREGVREQGDFAGARAEEDVAGNKVTWVAAEDEGDAEVAVAAAGGRVGTRKVVRDIHAHWTCVAGEAGTVSVEDVEGGAAASFEEAGVAPEGNVPAARVPDDHVGADNKVETDDAPGSATVEAASVAGEAVLCSFRWLAATKVTWVATVARSDGEESGETDAGEAVHWATMTARGTQTGRWVIAMAALGDDPAGT